MDEQPSPAPADKQIWIEKTLVEGRDDRQTGPLALGHALWSLTASRDGADIYRSIREVQPGDLVLHLVDNEEFAGVSVVSTPDQALEALALAAASMTPPEQLPVNG